MINNITIPLLISLIAGLSTVLGSLFVFIKPRNINSFIGCSLAFSASIMLFISILELIPQGFYYLKNEYSIFLAGLALIIMIVIGLLLSNIINNKLKAKNPTDLYRVGILSMIVLMIHNLPEGILTFLSTSINIKLGLKLGTAIMLHNIPEGIAIAVPIYYSTKSKSRAVKGTLVSGLSEPIGALLAYLFLYRILNNTLISIILLFVAGIMISISINEIFEEAKKYSKKSLVTGILLGIITIIVTEFIL